MKKKQKKNRLKRFNKQRKQSLKAKWGRCTTLQYCECGRIINNDSFYKWAGDRICINCQEVRHSDKQNVGEFPDTKNVEASIQINPELSMFMHMMKGILHG